MNDYIPRHHTALNRDKISRPIRLALESNLIQEKSTILDFGCGKGHDVLFLNDKGFNCIGWDPFYSPKTKRKKSINNWKERTNE